MPKQAQPTPQQLPDGRYKVDYSAKQSPTGIRQRIVYNTLLEAEEAIKANRKHILRYGDSLKAMPPLRASEAKALYDLLDEKNSEHGERFTLSFVVNHFWSDYEENQASILFGDLIDEYVASRSHLTDEYLRQFKYLKEKLCSLLQVKAVRLQHSKVQRILDPLPDHYFNSCLRKLTTLMKYALKKEYIARNPLSPIESRLVSPKEVKILTVEEAERMLRHAQKHYPHYATFMAIGLFGGVRPKETPLLEYRDLLFDEDPPTLVIRPEVAKRVTGQFKKRYIDMSDNLIAWLKRDLPTAQPHRRIVGMTPDAIVYAFRRCFEAIGKKTIKNPFRHSFGSYWLAAHKHDMGKLSVMLGHTNTNITMTRYNKAVSRTDAEKYFNLYP